MKRKPDLVSIVDECFQPGGALSKLLPAFRATDEQRDYARRVSTLLTTAASAPGDIPDTALIEAGTGIGKSLGYLVPVIAYCATTGLRAAVSTYTLELLHQLLRDAPLARAALAEHGGIDAAAVASVKIARRVGRQEFAAPSRVEAVLALTHWTAEERRKLQSLCLHAKSTGYTREWNDELPAGLTWTDIALHAGCPAQDFEAYARHAAMAKDAQLTICTHAALLLQASGRADVLGGLQQAQEGTDSDQEGHDVLVIDEADRLPSVADGYVNAHLPTRDLRRCLSDAGCRTATLDLVGELERQLADLCSAGTRTYLSTRPAERVALIEAIKPIAAALARVNAKGSTDDAAALSKELARIAYGLKLGSGPTLAYAQVSPTRAYPSLGLANAQPGRLLAALWNKERMPVTRMLLTSATLGTGSDASIASFSVNIGLRADEVHIRRDLSGSIEPKKFGSLRFVFADPAAPAPYLGTDQDDDTFTQNPAWLRYVADTVAHARAEGGRILVLTGSYDETTKISEALSARGIVSLSQQRSAESRRDVQHRFERGPAAIWISPTSWEGLNLPGLIDHLVIARVPFRPTTAGVYLARRDQLAASGMDANTAARYVAMTARADAFRRLRQGLGRPIRSPKDKATIWLCDRRIALPQGLLDAYLDSGREIPRQGDRGFYQAIPARFRADAIQAHSKVHLINGGGLWKASAFA